MKKIFLIIVILIFFCAFFLIRNSDPKVIISKLIRQGDIPEGTVLRYRINVFGLLPAGEAILSIGKIEDFEGKKVYHLTAEAKSLRLYSGFINASAILDSFVDVASLNTMLFKQRLSLKGKEDVYKEVYYNQKEGIMTIGDVKREILPNTQDPLSAVLNLINYDFEKINKLQMNINTNQKNYMLSGDVKNEEISLNKNKYTLVFAKAEIKRRDKNPYHKSNVTIVMLKEKGNLPVLIKVSASGVMINAHLIEVR